MATSSRGFSTPWPAPTPAGPSSLNRKRRRDRTPISRRFDRPSSKQELAVRDDIVDQPEIEAAMERCQIFSGNSVFSCWPTADATVAQHQFASFVWNSRLPQFAQTNLVNIYLFSATSQQVLLSIHNETNPDGRAGLIHRQVNDTWFGDRGTQWDGTNQTFLYYWVVTPNTESLDNRIVPQTTFTAVQTTFADSVVASMTSAAAASSASAASASSAAEASASRASESVASLTQGGGLSGTHTSGGSTSSSTAGGGGNVQAGSGGSSFPHWAIAVITVLGFLALLAGVILFFVILRCVRRRKGANLSHRGSMGSSTPMMANADNGGMPTTPVIAAGAYGAVDRHRPPSPEMHDGASTASRGSDGGLFSVADAAVMANAFRAALRKPNFADRPEEEGESPDSNPNKNQEPDLLNATLNEEGRDIRSVGSSRGVRVETLSDEADNETIHDRSH